MKIGIDAQLLTLKKTGIVEYAVRVVEGVLSLTPDAEFVGFLPLPYQKLRQREEMVARATAAIAGGAGRVTIHSRAFPPQKVRRKLWDLFRWPPIEAIIGDIDLYHGMSYVLPPRRRGKGVLTICDLSFLLFPQYHVPGMQSLSASIRSHAREADRVIAISEHTKRDVVEHLCIPEERVAVTLLAADEKYRPLPAEAVAPALGRYGIDREYLLYTGTLEPRKNVVTLVEAFHILKREAKIPHRLVLTGRKGWLYDDIFRRVEELGLLDEVIFTGFVPDEDLVSLYNGAALFAYPSRYEGFGLPPLEAMACGCPVVTSNVSSLPEVVGEAGLMVDPNRGDELAQAMGRVLADSGLHARMRVEGLARAARFSWERCVAETLAIYRELA